MDSFIGLGKMFRRPGNKMPDPYQVMDPCPLPMLVRQAVPILKEIFPG